VNRGDDPRAESGALLAAVQAAGALDAAAGALPGEPVVALVTARDRAQALEIAEALVGERLAACVNLLEGVTSVYRWQGKVCRDAEVLLVVKTRRALVPALTARVRALHTYECPETIALPVLAGSRAYIDWLAGETSQPVSGS